MICRMTTAKHVRTIGLALALAAAFASCGQRGPLTLPESARPIERLDPAAAPADQSEDEDERSENDSARE